MTWKPLSKNSDDAYMYATKYQVIHVPTGVYHGVKSITSTNKCAITIIPFFIVYCKNIFVRGKSTKIITMKTIFTNIIIQGIHADTVIHVTCK